MRHIKSEACSLEYWSQCIVDMDHHSETEHRSSAGSGQDFITGGLCFDPRLGKYSFRELMTVIVT